jgi:hypothetical protein
MITFNTKLLSLLCTLFIAMYCSPTWGTPTYEQNQHISMPEQIFTPCIPTTYDTLSTSYEENITLAACCCLCGTALFKLGDQTDKNLSFFESTLYQWTGLSLILVGYVKALWNIGSLVSAAL